jgi:hypothetical protein
MIIIAFTLFLLSTVSIQTMESLTYQNLLDKFNYFNQHIGKFPEKAANARIDSIVGDSQTKKNEVIEHATNARPIMHARVFNLCKEFLTHKLRYGSTIEQGLYKDMTMSGFINRLLTQRPLSFINHVTIQDKYLLRGPADFNIEGTGGFEKIGTEKENESKHLLLKNYLSYDEIQIAAYIGVASGTHFINRGSRGNNALINKDIPHIAQGIYVGLVGARFENPDVQEWQHMIITDNNDKKRTMHPDLQGVWERFYERKIGASLEEAKTDTSRYVQLYGNKGKDKSKPLNQFLEPVFMILSEPS